MTPGPAPTPKRREDDTALAAVAEKYRKPDPPPRFWLSPGARLGFAAIILLLVLLFLFTGLPAIQAKKQNDVDARQKAVAERQAAALLHTYDCTYGTALRQVLKAAARDKRVTQHLSLQSRHSNITIYKRTGNLAALRAAHRSLRGYRSAKLTAAKYGRLADSLRPLGRSYQGIPIPPCPRP